MISIKSQVLEPCERERESVCVSVNMHTCAGGGDVHAHMVAGQGMGNLCV